MLMNEDNINDDTDLIRQYPSSIMDTCVLVQGRAGLHDDGGEEVKHEVGEAVQPTLLNTDQTGSW